MFGLMSISDQKGTKVKPTRSKKANNVLIESSRRIFCSTQAVKDKVQKVVVNVTRRFVRNFLNVVVDRPAGLFNPYQYISPLTE